MPIVSALGAMSSRGFGEFAQSSASGKYIEDYFSTYLYTGNGTSQTISNGIGLSDTAAWSSYVLNATSSDAIPAGVTVDTSGNFYICGSDTGTNYSGTRAAALTAKYNSTGVLQWQRIAYSAAGNNYGGGVAVDTSGNVYSLFYNTSSGYRFNLRKYNSSGTLQWQRDLGGGSGINSISSSVAVDSASNAYVVGRSPEYSGDQDNIVVAKYNSSGTLQWQKLIRQSILAEGHAVAVDGSDNIYVVGVAYDGSYTYAILIKMDASGAITWQVKLRHSSNGSAGYSVAVDSSGNAYMGGQATDNSGSYSFVAKYNSSGTLQWQRYFYDGTSASQIVRGIYVNSSGDVHIAAQLSTSPSYAALAKYNSSGALQWQRKFPDVTTLNNNCLTGDSSGNLYLQTRTSTASSQFVIKLKSDGTTTSGFAFVSMVLGTATSASASLTSSTSTASNSSGSLTTATGAITDYAGALVSSTATQAAVTGAGGLVWQKNRTGTYSHYLWDTLRGAGYFLNSNGTGAQVNIGTTEGVSFSASGFSFGNNINWNQNGNPAASWTFRETPKFFDIVQYTGNGASSQDISHNLGSVPGMIITRRYNVGAGWPVYHRSTGNNQYLLLNETVAAATSSSYWNNTTPTSTQFTVGSFLNVNGASYIAYLFAHDAGGFGLDGTQNVISCGSFTTFNAGFGNTPVNLGWEPQLVLLKTTGITGNWLIFDNMRGISTGGVDAELRANSTVSEDNTQNFIDLTSTGFEANGNVLGASTSYIYMAIRRGPMKVPTDATTVFRPYYRSGSAGSTIRIPSTALSYAPDLYLGFTAYSGSSYPHYFVNRLADQWSLQSDTTSAEQFGPSNPLATFAGFQGQVQIGAAGVVNSSGTEMVDMFLRRAPGFFDVVCYSGNDVTGRSVSHNLQSIPELMIVKSRSGGASPWTVYASPLSVTKKLSLNTTGAAVTQDPFYATPTSSVFYLRNAGYDVNDSGYTYVAYLFASCPGVSKVGSYTGTGTTQQINCGFSAGARFILIKRVDDLGGSSAGGWYFWNSASGISSGNDPFMQINSNSQINPSTDYIDPYAAGFEITSTAPAAVNANGGTFIFLAIA